MLPSSNLGRIHLVLDPTNPSTLYASISNCCAPFSGIIGIFKTTDAGANWVQITNPPACCDWYANALAVDPGNSNVLLAGAGDLYRSLDGGQTWSNFSAPQANGISLHPDQHALGFSAAGERLYVGNDGGAFSVLGPESSTYNWNDLNGTLATITFYPGLSLDVANASNSFGGTQDNGTLHYTGTLGWNWTTCGDGSYTAIDFVSATNVYAYCPGPTIQKSTNSGVSGWFSVVNGIDTNDRFGWVAPLVMDPSSSQTLYVGSDRIYQTTNGASLWTPVSPDLTFGSNAISTIAVAPGAPNVVYAGTYDGNLQVTANATLGSGATWTQRTAGLPPRSITHVTVDPSSPSTAYVTVSGFGTGHVFMTSNSGASWTNISRNLPNAPANDLAVDPVKKTLYVATDVGVFFTKNAGGKWSTLVSGLPRVVVQSLQLHQTTRILRAVTHGRSAWDLQLH